jgi:hypothetical protein
MRARERCHGSRLLFESNQPAGAHMLGGAPGYIVEIKAVAVLPE